VKFVEDEKENNDQEDTLTTPTVIADLQHILGIKIIRKEKNYSNN